MRFFLSNPKKKNGIFTESEFLGIHMGCESSRGAWREQIAIGVAFAHSFIPYYSAQQPIICHKA